MCVCAYAGRGQMRKLDTLSVGKYEVKRRLERHCRRWENNNKMDLKETDERMWTGFMWFRTRHEVVLA